MFRHKTPLLLLILLCSTTLAELPAYTITSIGADTRDNMGHSRTRAIAINNSGQVLGEYIDYSPTGFQTGSHSVLWDHGSITHLPILSASSRGQHLVSPSPYGQPLLDSGQALLMGWRYNQNDSSIIRTLVWSDGTLKDIGDDIPNSTDKFLFPRNTNSAGQVLAVSARSTILDSYLWQNSTATRIGPFSTSPTGLSATNAATLNSQGQVIGAFDYYDTAGQFKGSHGFSWQNGGFVDLGSLSSDATGSGYSDVKVINDSGQIAGTATRYSPTGVKLGEIAVLWDHGTRKEIGTPALDHSFVPIAINQSGQILGSINYGPPEDITSYRTFIYSKGVLTTLAIPNLPNVSAKPLALNEAGQVIGNYSSSRGEAGFFWQNGVVSSLSFGNRSDGYGYTHVFLLTDDGDVYGTHMNFDGNVNTGFSAFRWNPTDGLTELNPLIADFAAQGWTSLEHIYDTNNLGQIVGYGTRVNGDSEGFILTPISSVPEPGPLSVLILALICCRSRRATKPTSTSLV